MRTRWFSACLASLLCLAGGYALLALLTGMADLTSVPSALIIPGQFLFRSFLWVGFFVPVYFFVSAILLVIPSFRRDWVAALTLSSLPFLTAALFLHVLFDEQPVRPAQLLIDAFGTQGGAFLVLLVFALELALIYRIWLGLRGPVRTYEIHEDDSTSGEARPSADRVYSTTVTPQERVILSLAEPALPETSIPDPPPLGGLRSAQAFERVDEATDLAIYETTPREDVFPEHTPFESAPIRSTSIGTAHALAQAATSAGAARDRFLSEPAAGTPSTPAASAFGAALPAPAVPPVAALPTPEPLIVFRSGSFHEAKRRPVDETWHAAEIYEFDLDEPDPKNVDLESTVVDEADVDATEDDAAEVEEIDVLEPEDEEPPAPRLVPAPAAAVAAVKPKRNAKWFVPLDRLLNDYPDGEYWVIDEETEKAAQILKRTLEEFNIQAEVTGIRKGPVITMFEILPAPGVKLSKIVNLADNIALRLAASRVRIVAPIPGKHAVGIEVPNKHRAIVSFKEMIASEDFNKSKMEIPVILGKDITGVAQIVDLVQTPHLLIAGATGSGKSVCVNSIICSILYCRRPEEVRMILIDPKIVELKLYNDIPHLMTPVITESKKAFQALQYCIFEMERRYSLLDSMGVRDIRSYNRRIRERHLATQPLPYILIIIDEFADLMATTGKELESTLARLAAMSRAVGIHLVIATQRPSIDVITGLIKANIPSRIAFMVASKFDSRIIIDAVGAEMLLGRGDMLFTSAWDPFPVRIQGSYLSEEEVERVTDHVRTLGEPDYIDEEIFFDDGDEEEFSLMNDDGTDPMFDQALDIVVSEGKASASYLQRRLKIGYNRAARIVEDFEQRGIVGPPQGSKPRELIHVPDRYKE